MLPLAVILDAGQSWQSRRHRRRRWRRQDLWPQRSKIEVDQEAKSGRVLRPHLPVCCPILHVGDKCSAKPSLGLLEFRLGLDLKGPVRFHGTRSVTLAGGYKQLKFQASREGRGFEGGKA